MDFAKTIINAIKIWVNKQLSFIENKISDLENRPSAFIQPEEPSETPDGTLWIDTDEDSISGVGSNTAESLTFTGVVEATYNGLSPVTVNIPKVTVNGITSDENGNIEIEVGSEQIQTDWNQNDSTQPDYIKNRTHWIEGSTYHTLSDNFIPETIARTSAVEEIKTLVGETPVSEQISEAIAEIPAVEIPVTSVNGQTGNVVIEAGGVTSWNDLKDKPFGTEGTRVVAEWDGNTEGREFFTNYALYKVSDLVPAMSDMVGVKYVYKYSYDKTVEHTFAEDDMVQFNGYYIIQDVMIVIENDNSTLSNDTLSTGIYVIIRADDSLCHDCAYYITSMTIADTTITFDGVTAEENVVYLKDDISIFGNEVEYYYKISDAAPTLADWESTNAIATTFMGNQFCLWGFIQEWTAETQTTEIIPCPFIGVFGVYGSMTNANNKKLSHGIYVKKGIKKIAYGDYTTQKIDTDYYLTDLIVYGYPFVDGSTVLDPSHMFSDINEAFKSGRTVVFTDINHIVANRGIYYYLQDVEIDNYYHFTSHTGKYTHDIYVYADDTWEYKVTMSNDISWHELANRPFYTEISDDTEVLFENQNFSVREQRGMTVCNLPDGTTLTAGDVYIVVVNGTEYTLTAAEADYHGYASVYLGDFSIANEFNTSPEVDVCVLYIVEMNATMLIVPGSLETITASLYKGTEIVHTLNEKFIPNTIARVDNIPEINYPVTSVNGMTGDVEIVIPEQKDITVNGVAPDENGNIEIEVTSSGGSAGGVTSWNDLTDRPFEECGEKEVVLENQSVTAYNVSGVGQFYLDMSDNPLQFVSGSTYTLIIDGAEYIFTAADGEFDGQNTTYIGDLTIITDNNTSSDAKVCVAYAPESNMLLGAILGLEFPKSGKLDVTISLYVGSVTIKTLDPKFLPEGGVGYTENAGAVSIEYLAENDRCLFTYYSTGDHSSGSPSSVLSLTPGTEYTVIIDGVETKLTAREYTSGGDTYVYVGDYNWYMNKTLATDIGFYLETNVTDYYTILYIKGERTHATLTVYYEKSDAIVHQISEQYIPDAVKLPVVSTDNNGQILKVVEGVWTPTESTISYEWPYIANKPVFSTDTQTLTWDGETSGHGRFSSSSPFYWIAPLPVGEIYFVAASMANGTTYTTEKLLPEYSIGCVKYGSSILVVRDKTFVLSNTTYTGTPGIYFASIGGNAYVNNATYTTTQFYDWMIPDTIARTSDIPKDLSGSWNDLTDKPFESNQTIIDWDGSTEGRDSFEFNGVAYYKLSDVLPAPDELIGGLVESDVGDVDTIDTSLVVVGENGFAVSSIMFVQSETFTVANISATAPSVGCYGAITPIGYVTKLTYESIKTLDEKYIPDTIARVEDITAPKTELILTSSTSDSSKQFKITIDDEGVLTATEIVESAT